MYIASVPNRGAKPTILLRQSYREGKTVRKRTLANLTHLPPAAIEAVKLTLKGKKLVPIDEAFVIQHTRPHGHVKAILQTIRKIGLDQMIASKPGRERDLVLAMIVERLLHGGSKLASTRLWHATTLADELSVGDADENELYAAMDWLVERQERIEKKLAAKHLDEGCQVLYDLSSSYYEGHTCPLARRGRVRDKKNCLVIAYGLLTDCRGRPIAVEVYPGDTGDPTTVPDQVSKMRDRFGLKRVVLVGDRGTLTETQIDKLKEYPQLGWISALRSTSIRKLIEKNHFQRSLFDTQNLAEITSSEFPGERLVACFNPSLSDKRAGRRQELLAATEKRLGKLAKEVARRTKTPLMAAEIGVKVGKIINRYKVGKHFTLHIKDGIFRWERNEESIQQEAALDGIYVIRTSEPAKRLSAEDTVRSYKGLSRVEWAFRCLKGIDIRVRPIHHREELRVRSHVFLCMLAYYVEWHLRDALGDLLFDDEEATEDRKQRDPVAPATPSASACRKKVQKTTPEGLPVHSFQTLLTELGTLCRNTCRAQADPTRTSFAQDTVPNALQAQVFERLDLYPVSGNPVSS